MSKLIIGADIVPTASNQTIFENAQMDQIVSEDLLRVLRDADYRIFNLEVPLTDRETPIKKCGPNLIASTKSVVGLKQLNIDFLTLANNHILDQGEQGLWSTIEQLDKASIAYAGVGRTLEDAAKPYTIELGGRKIGIYCCAEHEFSIVSERQAGANPFDPFESLDHIRELKVQCDYVICLYHGGKEHYRYPSPNLQKICRKIVEEGADLVVCQHTHCIGCEEKWQEGTIVYGQGNFLFDHSESEFWKTSVLISVDMSFGLIEYIPICKDGNAVKLAQGTEKQTILSNMTLRTENIKETGFVKETFESFCEELSFLTLDFCIPITDNIIFKIVNCLSGYRLGEFISKKYENSSDMIKIRNHIECETWREIILMRIQKK